MRRSPSPSSEKGIYRCLWHRVFPRFEMPYGIGFTSFVVLVEACHSTNPLDWFKGKLKPESPIVNEKVYVFRLRFSFQPIH